MIGFVASARICPPTPKVTRAERKHLLPRAREQEGDGDGGLDLCLSPQRAYMHKQEEEDAIPAY